MAYDPPASAAISRNPATGEELAQYPYQGDREVEHIVSSSREAFGIWSRFAKAQRADYLRRVGGHLDDQEEELAHGIVNEMGKPITAARAEVVKCADLCRWYADHLTSLLADEEVDVGGDGRAVVSYLPLGTVLGVMPWNFPLWQVLRAAVPILGAGNSFLLKHADNVQGCALALARVFAAAGLPQGTFGVLNIARSQLPNLIADPRITAITVTAGVAAGSALAAEAGSHLKKSVLELGGSDPFIVLADADLDRAVAAAIEARFQNGGQVCIAAKRLIVEKAIAPEFTRRFVAAAADLNVGDPLDPATKLGPLARHRGRDELHSQVQQSIAMGAKLILGGTIPDGPGAFYTPTVLSGVTFDMPVVREETFGPVAVILVADDAEHAIRIANDSDYGLSGALWSRDTERAARLAQEIETGGVFVNGMSASDPRVPIGGIKASGYGRELSHFGLREFCNVQLRWIRS